MKGKQSKIDSSKKIGSLAFFTAIPAAILLSYSGLSALLAYISLTGGLSSNFVFFLIGALMPVGAVLNPRPTYFKTLIHEAKHATLVVLTGNKLRGMSVNRDSGLVTYDIYDGKKHFGPFIMLAPYFFPIFSLPTLLTCLGMEIFIGRAPMDLMIALLGMALATDLISSYLEFHPHQTDLQRIIGGKLFVPIFLLGVNCLWITVCLLYTVGGTNALAYAGLKTVHWALNIIAPS